MLILSAFPKNNNRCAAYYNRPAPYTLIPNTTMRFQFRLCTYLPLLLERVNLDLQLLQADSTFMDIELPSLAKQSVIGMKRQHTVRSKIPHPVLAIFFDQLETVPNAFKVFGQTVPAIFQPCFLAR